MLLEGGAVNLGQDGNLVGEDIAEGDLHIADLGTSGVGSQIDLAAVDLDILGIFGAIAGLACLGVEVSNDLRVKFGFQGL